MFEVGQEIFHRGHGYGKITHWFPNNKIVWVTFDNYATHFVKGQLKEVKIIKTIHV